MKIVVGTFVLAVFVSLDGDGSTTYMITCAAMLPLYKRLGISRLVLACVIMMAGGLMNILPWGGPTARAASALGVDVGLIFVPMILPMVITRLWGVFVAFNLGRRERNGAHLVGRLTMVRLLGKQQRVRADHDRWKRRHRPRFVHHRRVHQPRRSLSHKRRKVSK